MNVVAVDALPELTLMLGSRVGDGGHIGMRPEALHVCAQGQGALKGRVTLVEALGADTLIHANVGSVPLVARQNTRSTLRAGDAIELDVDLQAIHRFDAKGATLRT
jgi:multiple sugar transport system ATP-binding protein